MIRGAPEPCEAAPAGRLQLWRRLVWLAVALDHEAAFGVVWLQLDGSLEEAGRGSRWGEAD
eukprot:scaffold48823_cov27-Tisochrysis_lutea.AAC.2